jgi:large subunit ribosomal protein L19
MAQKAKTQAKKHIKAKKVSAPTGTTTDLIRRVTMDRQKSKKALPEFQTGDSVGVYVKVKEGEKERVQLFAGVVLKVQGSGAGRSFTVRKIASGVGVERTFPMLSPIIDRVEIISRGKVRRSRLFFLRGLKGRSARLDSEAYFDASGGVGAADEVAAPETAEAAPAAEKAPKVEKPAAKPAKK